MATDEDALYRAWIDGYETAVAMVEIGARMSNGIARRTCEDLAKTLRNTRDDAAEMGDPDRLREQRERDVFAALRRASSAQEVRDGD